MPQERHAVAAYWLGHVSAARALLAARVDLASRQHPGAFQAYLHQATSSAEPFLCQPDPSSPSEDAAWLQVEPLYAVHRNLQSALLLLCGVARGRLRQLLAENEAAPSDGDMRRIHQAAILVALEECWARDRRPPPRTNQSTAAG